MPTTCLSLHSNSKEHKKKHSWLSKVYVASLQQKSIAAAAEADSLDFELNVVSSELVCNQPGAPDANCHGGWLRAAFTNAGTL